ncbi:unnamed protein product, partial [Pylaiella littoralis]
GRQVPRELTSGTTGSTRVRGGSRTSCSRKREGDLSETRRRKRERDAAEGQALAKRGRTDGGDKREEGYGGHKGSGVVGLECTAQEEAAQSQATEWPEWKTCRAEWWCSCCQRCGAETTGYGGASSRRHECD